MVNHQNLFHEALTKAHDIAKNGTRNTAAWQEILEVIDGALNEARRIDAEVQRKWPRTEQEAAEAADVANTGGKSYYRPPVDVGPRSYDQTDAD